MRKLIIEKAAVRANMAVIKERARGAALYGVLTGDGGGAGLTELARLIRDEGISRFAVGTVEEAQALREAGFEDEELLMLRATVDREELERLVDLNVVCTISSVDVHIMSIQRSKIQTIQGQPDIFDFFFGDGRGQMDSD